MKKYLILLLLAISLIAQNQEIYSQIRVDWGYTSQIANDIVRARPGVWAEYAIPESRLANLDFKGIPYETIIPDMREEYRKGLDTSMDMGGWRTYDEIKAAIDSLHNDYPEYVSEPESIGCGHNGNAIWIIKISDNVDIDEDEPEVLIGLGIHCREVISMEIIVQFAQWLMQNYGTDDRATHIVDHREVWFIPLMNPDGYRYNELTSPGGGGMWRKNRRNNGDGTWGVDLNRNFSYMWGIDDIGSSPDPVEETYRGPSAASEPETQAINEFVNSREFRSSLSFHSYSNLYLSPWGYTYTLCEDNDWFLRIDYRYARNNGYVYGPGAETIYPTNGDTDDWFYGDTTEHSKILAVTPEVGSWADGGFWPDLELKQPLVDENRPACLVCCEIAGSAPFMTNAWIDDAMGDTSGYIDPGETARLMIEVENLGWEPTNAYVLASYEGTGVAISPDTAWVGDIISQGYDTTFFEIYLDPSRIDQGDKITLYFEIRDTSGHLTYDSTHFIAGTPQFVLSYSFETDDGGLSGTGDWEWGIPTVGPDAAHSGVSLWATKLDTNYTNNTLSVLSLPPMVVPDDGILPRLTFWHWYSFETPDEDIYDGGNVQITTDGGVSWTILSPIDGYAGVAFEHNDYVGGDSVFTGLSNGWENAIFDLTAYEGMSVEFRIFFGSDPYVSSHGWYVDDIALTYYIETGFSADGISTPSDILVSAYPNPFNAACKIDLESTPPIRTSLGIYDISGRLLRTFEIMPKTRSIIWDGKDSAERDLPNGIYLMRLIPDGKPLGKLVLVK